MKYIKGCCSHLVCLLVFWRPFCLAPIRSPKLQTTFFRHPNITHSAQISIISTRQYKLFAQKTCDFRPLAPCLKDPSKTRNTVLGQYDEHTNLLKLRLSARTVCAKWLPRRSRIFSNFHFAQRNLSSFIHTMPVDVIPHATFLRMDAIFVSCVQ